MYRLIRINRIKHLLDRKMLLLLINAFVFNKLFYCSTVWSNTSKTNVKRLEVSLVLRHRYQFFTPLIVLYLFINVLVFFVVYHNINKQ